MQSSDVPVVIVGAGPTGVMLAIELARRGVEVSIIDKQAERSPESRAIGIHARTLEIFHQLGIVEQFLDFGHRVDGFTVHTRARRSLRVDFGGIDSRYPFMLTLSQAETQRILEEHLASLGVRVQRAVRVHDVLQDGDVVELRGDGGVRRAGWVVGCDGAHSVVRRSLGLAFEGEDYSQDWLMAEASLDAGPAREHFHVFAYTDPPLPVFPMPGDRWRLFLPQVGGRPDDRRPPDMEEIARLVAARGPAGMKLSDPSLMATFRCYLRSTKLMRRGRVLIAGDAAHVHSPAGGQGMNTGLHDAFNLGWKLALVARGQTPDALLDSYPAERAPIAASVLALTHGLVRTFTVSSSGKRWLRDRAMPAVGAVPGAKRRYVARLSQTSHNYRGGSAAPAAPASRRHGLGPGDRLPDVPGLRHGGEPVSLLDLLGSAGHTLLVLTGGSARARDAEARFGRWRSLMRTVVIDVHADEGVVADSMLRAHRRYGARRGGLVLVRPDGYVARTAPLGHPEILEQYLERLSILPSQPPGLGGNQIDQESRSSAAASYLE